MQNGARRGTTIRDVAALAGVSVAAVSRALNGSGYVSEEIKQRVLQAAHQLRYRPHASARGLKLQSTHTLGLIIADITNPFYAQLADAVLTSARRLGYHVILAATDEQPAMEEEYLNVLLEKRVDGILAVATGDNSSLWRDAHDLGIQVVLVDREIASLPEADVVLIDNKQGALEAVTYLLGLGHKRIGIINGPTSTTTGAGRLEGYYLAHQQAGLTVDEHLVQIVSFKRESGVQAVQQLLALPEPPTAIFASNNVLGETTVFVLRERGLRIGADISLLMFDDVPWASLISPPLTVVAQPIYQLGTTAVELLIRRLQERDSPSAERRETVLTPTLIVRESCVAPRLL